jgi:hypothetical protein
MATTNFINGVTNVAEPSGQTLGSLVFPDPTRVHTWFDDFDDYTTAEWLITAVGSGTLAVGNLDGGILVITNAAADDDHQYLQWSGNTAATTVETWKWETSKAMWFKARFKVSDATQSDFVMGLQITDTTPLDVTDGLFFIKSDGSASMTFRAEKNDTASTVTVATITDDTYFTCGFWWDPDVGELKVYYNDNPVGTISSTANFPDDEELTISFAIQNGEAVAKSMSIDYIFVAKDRQASTI